MTGERRTKIPSKFWWQTSPNGNGEPVLYVYELLEFGLELMNVVRIKQILPTNIPIPFAINERDFLKLCEPVEEEDIPVLVLRYL